MTHITTGWCGPNDHNLRERDAAINAAQHKFETTGHHYPSRMVYDDESNAVRSRHKALWAEHDAFGRWISTLVSMKHEEGCPCSGELQRAIDAVLDKRKKVKAEIEVVSKEANEKGWF
jgi:hypothetical protein